MLVISLTIVIAAIVPEWEKFSLNKSELSKKKAGLENMSLKKQNIEKLNTYLLQKKEDVALVAAYLPEKQNDERIVDGINFLAVGSGVALDNIDVEEVKTLPSESQEVSVTSPMTFGMDPANAGQVANTANKAKFSRVNLKAVGSYESLAVFISSLDKFEFFNSIKSLNIAEEDSTGKQAGEADDGGPQLLVAEMEMEFGYLPKVSAVNGYIDPLFEKSGYDESIIEELKGAIQRKVPNLDVTEQGRSNPFAL